MNFEAGKRKRGTKYTRQRVKLIDWDSTLSKYKFNMFKLLQVWGYKRLCKYAAQYYVLTFVHETS